MTARASSERDLDLVVVGATGFVGQLVAGYLADAAPAGLRIGLAGRSPVRLAAVRERLGSAAEHWPLLVADLAEPASLARLAQQTRVVATAAGPFARIGLSLVDACVATGTDYADLTGEVLFVRDSVARFHDAAATSGVRIVHACGVDAIPSDLGVQLLAEAAREQGAGTLCATIGLVTAFRGGFSGGTWASARRQVEETTSHPERQGIVDDPYALSPDRTREPEVGEQHDLHGIEHDREHGRWLAPFIMAGFNTRIVRRSNALQGWAYGRRLRYREALAFPEGPGGALRAAVQATWLEVARTASGWSPARPVLDRLLPAAGEGPDERSRRSGRFTIEIHTRTSEGSRLGALIDARGNPGYTASPLMFGQAALCLVLDRDRMPSRAGVLTPATALGTPLVQRLRAAGLVIDVVRAMRS